jgi:xanthine dehydrogenase accessory factor
MSAPYPAIAPRPVDVLACLRAWAQQGGVVLVTLVGIEGRSARAVGSQMVVAANGRTLGSFSGGCIDGAIVAEAQAALAAKASRLVRFGVGSPYVDVRLPCGGGIDLLFEPQPDAAAVDAALAALAARQPASLALGGYTCHYAPPLRIVALGQGEDLLALARLAASFGAQVEAHTPDAALLADLRACGASADHLASRTQPPQLAGDPWTAFVFFFHDHDWEEALMPPTLAQTAFYHGAIGSRATHAARLAMLQSAGVPGPHIALMRGHIGMIAATRQPAMLALSVLAEVAAQYQTLADAAALGTSSLSGTDTSASSAGSGAAPASTSLRAAT